MLNAKVIPVTPFAQNCSLLWDTETMNGALVDPGGDVDKLVAALEEEGVELEKILVTHGHLDHAGAVAEIARRFDVPIEGPHRDDLFLIEDLPKQSQRFNFPGGEVFSPDRWLKNGDEVQVGGLTLWVRHCPGHTPGHVIFYEPKGQVAFVGDVLFQGSIGRTDFPRGDFNQLVSSITENLWPLGDDVRFVPGHGSMSTFRQERMMNPFVSDLALGKA